MKSSGSKDAPQREIVMSKPRHSTLVSVNEFTANAHPFFAMTTWPQIEQIIIETLKENGFESTVCAMTRESTAYNASVTGDNPVIAVHTIPEKDNHEAAELKIAIQMKLRERGFNEPIEFYFESRDKRPTRPVLAPIDIPRTRVAFSSSLSGQASPFVPGAEPAPSGNLPETNTESLPTGIASAPITPFGSKSNTGKSVKHLTCYYWRTTGKCRFSDDECLYSHSDTGKYADQPRPLIPGGRSVAGKNAERVEAVVNEYRRNHSGAYPGSAHELGLPQQAQYNGYGQHLMASHNSYAQLPASAPAQVRTQFPLIPASVMPHTLNKRAKSALGINQVYAEDGTSNEKLTSGRRLTVGAGRPISSTSGDTVSSTKHPTPRINVHQPAASGTWILPTPSTASWGPYSAPFSAPLGAPLGTPLTTPGTGTYPNASYAVAACRELCIGLDTQVHYLHELNKHLFALGNKYPTIHTQMTPVFDVIRSALDISVQKRAGAQILMRDDQLFGYVFGRGDGVGSMAAPTD